MVIWLGLRGVLRNGSFSGRRIHATTQSCSLYKTIRISNLSCCARNHHLLEESLPATVDVLPIVCTDDFLVDSFFSGLSSVRSSTSRFKCFITASLVLALRLGLMLRVGELLSLSASSWSPLDLTTSWLPSSASLLVLLNLNSLSFG